MREILEDLKDEIRDIEYYTLFIAICVLILISFIILYHEAEISKQLNRIEKIVTAEVRNETVTESPIEPDIVISNTNILTEGGE